MRKNREELQKIMASSHPKPFAKESKIYTYENFVYEMAQKEFTIHEARERLKELYAQNITISQKDIEKIKELIDKKVTISNICKIIGVGTRQSLNNYIKSRIKIKNFKSE